MESDFAKVTITLYSRLHDNNFTSTTSPVTTENSDSDLSSFEKFCGHSPFWDTDLLVDSSYPKFTECFRQVAVAWIPCLLYIVVCVPYLYYVLRKPSVPAQIGLIGVAKTICLICLLGITIATIVVRATDDDQDGIPDALYVSEGLKIAAFILALVVSVLERNKGMVASPVSWTFWVLLFIANIIPFYSNLKEDKKDSDEFGFIIFIFFHAFVLLSFIIASFTEPRKLAYRDLSLPDTKKAKPKAAVNINGEVTEESPLLPSTSAKEQENPTAGSKEKSPYKQASVLKVVFINHGLLLVGVMITKAAFDCFIFATPKITEALLDYITYKDQYYEWRGYALAAGYLVVNSITSIVGNQSIFYIKRTSLRIKSVLINAIYRKSLTAANIDDQTAKGEIVNLMSVDCQRLEEVSYYIHLVFSAPLQIAVALYLLYDQLGTAVFAGMGVLFITLPINMVLGHMFEVWQMRMMEYKDGRINLLTEILNGIKVLKLYAWEYSFQQKIEAIRNKELNILKNLNFLVAFVMYFFMALPSLVQVTSFAVHINKVGYLDPTVAFVSLQLFTMLNTPLMLLPLLIPSLIQSYVSFKRISNYLNKSDIKPDSLQQDRNSEHAVEIKGGNFTWNIDQPLPTLRNINMQVKPGSLVAVVGTVGCGKSSLISAVLGEMERLSGLVTLKGTTAYVPQEAWIQNNTLRNNITFGKDYVQGRYDKIIEACALKPDFDILPGGDLTEIGEKGINISGGQKQRVSLARALYSDRDIFLLDDPLSAVDSHVGQHIFKEVIGENGLLKQKTRILVTHGIHWLPTVDKIFVMTNGEISETGTYAELLEKDGDFAQFLKEFAQNGANKDDEDGGNSSDDAEQESLVGSIGSNKSMELTKRPALKRRKSRKSSTSSLSVSLRRKDGKEGPEKPVEKAGTRLTEEETGLSGSVRFSTYLYYFQQIGWPTCITAIVLYTMYAGCSIFAGIWLTEWTSDDYLLNRSHKDTDKYHDDNQDYLTVYAAASVGQGLFVFVFYFIAAIKMMHASKNLHSNMLSNVLRSPMSFFDTTPIGRLTNRFSRDVQVLDDTLTFSIKDSLNVFAMVVVTIVNISYGTPIFLVALVPLTVMYIAVQALYIPTCRQLRRIDSITRSPIYVHFSETLNGSNSIRAYGCQERFIEESADKINHNLKFIFATFGASSWLTLRLQFLGNMVIFAAAIFAVAASDIDPSVVGLSVSYASSMTFSLEELVNAMSETETNIVSVERIKEYTISPQEAAWEKDENKPKPSWPDEGNIVFNNYQTRYRPGLDLVLKDMTCTIKGGEKVGIVGRTGAGKSSMTVALFRIIEAAGGSIVIDGEEISNLGLHDLRSKLTILPQDPVIFCGTMRMNLDPFDQYDEPALWSALEHSYLKDFVEGLPARLEYECGEEGSNLSVGQRQLVCLARTLLRKTKILVLDEATAAVDMETDDLIQKTIRREFKDCTILTIAHRLNTIVDYDRVMVLDQGSIKEFDSPSALLNDENSIFYGMAKNAGLV